MRSVARPRILGPIAVATTLTTVSARTAYVLWRSGRSRAKSRLSDGQNVSAFWPIIPPPIGPRPGPGPAWMRSVSLRVPGLAGALVFGAHEATSSTVSWDWTISW